MITVKELIEALQLEEDKSKYVSIKMRDYDEHYKIYEFDYSYNGIFDIVIAPED